MSVTAAIIECSELDALIKQNKSDLVIIDCHYEPQAKPDLGSYPFAEWDKIRAWTSERKYYKDYEANHIIGARHTDMDTYLQPTATSRRALYTAEQFQSFMQWMGVNAGDTIVLYDRTPVMMFAARLWSTMQGFGETNVKLLRGGFNEWTRLGLPTSSKPEQTPKKGNWTAKPNANFFVSTDELVQMVTANKAEPKLFDARPAAQYNGTDRAGWKPDVSGSHFPNTNNMPVGQFFDNGVLKDKTVLTSTINNALSGCNRVVTLCNHGVQASVLLFVITYATDGKISAQLHSNGLNEVCNVKPDALV